MSTRRYVIAGTALAAVAVGVVAWPFAYYALPFAWTGEPDKLATLLDAKPGARLADIGAGSGALAIEMAERVGVEGLVYATDIDPDRTREIEARVSRASLSNVRAVQGASTSTNLPAGCCDAVYMRMMFHHVDDRPAFARAVAQAVRPGGRVAVIDFPPGALCFEPRHGISPEAVVSAFEGAGCRLQQQDDAWGGASFLRLFTCGGAPAPTGDEA